MLRAVGLACGYVQKPVLTNLDFKVDAGAMLGIVGPNGSGKTTLLRTLSRGLPPIAGKVYWRRRDLHALSAREAARSIAVVSQNVPISNLTVEEFILLGRIPHSGLFQLYESSRDLGAVEKAMVLTDTLGFRNRVMARMSGGERQRVFIARALAQEPELLVLDEPTTHLDITHQVRILDLLRRLNRESGLGLIMVLHDLNLAGEYCRELMLVHAGGIRKFGPAAGVLNRGDIEAVFETEVRVQIHPVSSRPYVVLVSEGVNNHPSCAKQFIPLGRAANVKA